jgi:hypothetical protein
MRNELMRKASQLVSLIFFLFTLNSLLVTRYCPYAFPNTIASSAILTYKPYSIWRK